ncbi:quercetin dioxygenase-like cupin family protein [Kitasatospora gansuensis]|uniref:Quercetin dioxygenase-like cupin family protein n=1 Tax=Kitasatospora gansuensis TaxID=258050 RepID=A0A7W7SIY6_9ACTN|nr:cupin domain-containing protein [Kitasatospora gansuensis]MBB4951321.1 quercetin dioxygenase-like cupin family protein [Kitasatospora gansuensis]
MNIKRTGTAVLGALLLGFLPTVAGATPGSGVTATLLGKGTSDGSITLKAKGRTDVVFREITIAPGGTTGWHYHPGQVLAVVKSGTLTRKLDDCATEVTPAGGVVVEPAGHKHTHIGYNYGTEPVVLLVTYLVPEGSPLSVDMPAPSCA